MPRRLQYPERKVKNQRIYAVFLKIYFGVFPLEAFISLSGKFITQYSAGTEQIP
jgi:hypothetical protein